LASMFVNHLEVNQFRNLAHLRLPFSRSLTIFYGENAQGKTNLLEAIYLLTSLRTFRSIQNVELINFSADSALVKGKIHTAVGEREVEVRLEGCRKSLTVDGKRTGRIGDYANEVKAVLFVPGDLSLIQGKKSVRRDFLDRAICHIYAQHSDVLRQYARVVSQRNRLLAQRTKSGQLFETWTDQLVELGSRIMATRGRFVKRLRSLWVGVFSDIAQMDVEVDLKYRPSLPIFGGLEGTKLRSVFREELAKGVEEEFRRGITFLGPHRDDLTVLLGTRLASKFCSQGQARLLSLCLKIMELRVLLEDRGIVPVFLLDDVSSELDEHRNEFLMKYLAGVGCQVFITTTSLQHVCASEFDEVSIFRVSGGDVFPEPLEKSIS